MGQPLATSEKERLNSLHDLQLLDTQAAEMFDRVTSLASVLFHSEFAVISLIDETRQWFLSRQGLDLEETPRDHAFCSVTVALECELDVPDASLDERFADNPLVTGEPHIRSYLGYPVRCPDGHIIGTLAVIDPAPRKFAGLRRKKLAVLAGEVEDLILAHKQTLAMTEMADRERRKHDALPDLGGRVLVAV